MHRRLRPSPALVISLIALMIALGGTGYAAFRIPDGSVGTPQLKNGAVTARKVHRHTLLLSDFKPGQLSAGGAVQGPAGPRGPQGPPGPQGASGIAGTARAYGLVSASGGLNTARSKNIAGVTHPSGGVYCITLDGINPGSTTIVVTPDEGNAGLSGEIGHLDSASTDCPA